MKKIKKVFFVPAILFLIGASCFIAYMIKGSYVAADGLLVEPFYLIPIGWLFIFAAVISGIIVGIITKLRKKSSKKEN